MFYCKAWIFSGWDMNEWMNGLSLENFPSELINREIFLHQRGCNFYSTIFSWVLFLRAENEQWHSSHGKESRKGGVDFSSSSAWTSIPHSSETTSRQAPLGCCQQTQSSVGLSAALSRSIWPPFLPGSTRHFIQGQELPAAGTVGVPSAFACVAISRVPDQCLTSCTDNLKKCKWLNFQPLTFPAAILHHLTRQAGC